MNKRFLITGLYTTIINLLLHAIGYTLVLKDFYQSHPAGPEEFVNQLHRKPDQLIVWALVATSVTMGYLITLIMKWSGAKTFLSGLKYGSIVGFLFWGSVNFGIYASSNVFSQAGMFVDLICSGTSMTIAAACAAWILNLGKKSAEVKTS
jgi:hypothetical protein